MLFPQPRELVETGAGAPSDAPVHVQLDPSLPPDGYTLETTAGGIRITHRDERGLRYARSTLAQLAADHPSGLPGVRIRDWPDFPVRGYMLDVSRDRVPTRDTLQRLVGICAIARINHVELYTEHTFAYADHEVVWRDASPITPEDVRWLDALCAEHGIELVPNQNCFGHMARWLAARAVPEPGGGARRLRADPRLPDAAVGARADAGERRVRARAVRGAPAELHVSSCQREL